MYFAELLGIALFAATGVLAVSRRGLDLVGAVMLGLVTALGGGTLRDLLIRYPIFWFENHDYFWAAVIGGFVTFFATTMIQNAQRSLLYLDALGAALFTIAAADKVLVDPRLSATLAVMLGVLTGIGGGILRDVLAGRQTLLVSRDIYATPILVGCTVFVMLRELVPGFPYAALTGAALIFTLRALAIWFHLQMPAWLVK